jgi:hypothetical protein
MNLNSLRAVFYVLHKTDILSDLAALCSISLHFPICFPLEGRRWTGLTMTAVYSLKVKHPDSPMISTGGKASIDDEARGDGPSDTPPFPKLRDLDNGRSLITDRVTNESLYQSEKSPFPSAGGQHNRSPVVSGHHQSGSTSGESPESSAPEKLEYFVAGVPLTVWTPLG